VMYEGECLGVGTPDSWCICACHNDAMATCDTTFCAPVKASASDNVRLRHVNRDADRGKRTSKRGFRSTRGK
jgi:hypothetical protein